MPHTMSPRRSPLATLAVSIANALRADGWHGRAPAVCMLVFLACVSKTPDAGWGDGREVSWCSVGIRWRESF